jgi:hypothetical protein
MEWKSKPEIFKYIAQLKGKWWMDEDERKPLNSAHKIAKVLWGLGVICLLPTTKQSF